MAIKKRKKRSKAKKAVRRKAVPTARATKKKVRPKPKKVARRNTTAKKHKVRGKSSRVALVEFGRQGLGAGSGGQSGGLQGMSRTAGADSESVEELIEEGNTLEAEL